MRIVKPVLCGLAAVFIGYNFISNQSMKTKIGQLEGQLEIVQAQQAVSNRSLNPASNLNIKLEDSNQKKIDEKKSLSDMINRFEEQDTMSYGKPNDYLTTKGGFRFELEDTKAEMKFTNAPPIRLFANFTGKEYSFEIEKRGKHVMESLRIAYYNMGTFPSVSVSIEDAYHTGIVNKIYIFDKENNTRIIFTRSNKGKIECDSNGPEINDESAKSIFDYYQVEYTAFRKFTGIDKKIADYKPKLEINSKNTMSLQEEKQVQIK